MSSFYADRSVPSNARTSSSKDDESSSNCNFLEFLDIVLSGPDGAQLGMQAVLTTASPTFADVSMGGISCEVRKAKASSFPVGLADPMLKGRDFLVVKQPRLDNDGNAGQFDELAIELQILRDERVRRHQNVIDLLSVIYHNAGSGEELLILPCLLLEYAEYGNLKDYQERGYATSIQERFDICTDVAEGLRCIHDCGIIHGDIKSSNMLICKSTTRKFVVKLSDFGFAISMRDENPRLIGRTMYLDAPESEKPLQRDFLVQLDIYSYGLLLFSVLKKGRTYYESLSGDQQQSIGKLKATNLLPSLLQLNILHNMNDEKCLLLVFCNILAWCLRADPAERFPNMRRILDTLTWGNPGDLDLEKHKDEPLYKLFDFPTDFWTKSKAHFWTSFNKGLDEHCEKLESLQTPMVPMLKDMYRQRMELEVKMIDPRLSDPQDQRHKWCGGRNLTLWRWGMAIGNPVPYIKYKVEMENERAENSFIELMAPKFPDLPKHHNIIMRMPNRVKTYLFRTLQSSVELNSNNRNHWGMLYNLGYCFIDSIGTGEDIRHGLALVERAAVGGCHLAQTHVLKFYSTLENISPQHINSIVEWCRFHLEDHNPAAMRLLRTVAETQWTLLQEEWYTNHILQLAAPPQRVLVDRPPMTWRAKLLHYAATCNIVRLAEMLLQEQHELVHAKNVYGQTPLIAACQAAHIEMALYFIAQGADVNAKDDHGVVALHWLITFHEEDKDRLVAALQTKNMDPNVYGHAIDSSVDSPNLHGRPKPGTISSPLHWAVYCRDLHAVNLLLDNGGNAMDRLSPFSNTPFESACCLQDSTIIQRFLQDPNAAIVCPEYRQLSSDNASVVINPLFWALGGGSKFQRLMHHGHSLGQACNDTIKALVATGCACDSVLKAGPLKMSAPFATAYHHCNADIMQSGMANGFCPYVDTTFGGASSGGPPMSLALAHNDTQMFQCLLENGASVTWRNIYNQSALSLLAKETDDVWFAEQLLQRGAPVDDDGAATAFWTAVYAGNLKVAKLLWDRGAKRDSRVKDRGLTILGQLIGMRTRNAGERMRFILGLPDRDESDGFEVLHSTDVSRHKSSALHFAVSPYFASEEFREDPMVEEGSRLTLSLLLQKYGAADYVNSTVGPHHDVPLGMAVEVGNYHAVRLLLQAGANVNAQDEYGRTPMDKLYWRYCFPATLDVLAEANLDDREEVQRRLSFVNQNTSEIYSLLVEHQAKSNVFVFPGWHASDPGYRNIEWVINRLRENKTRAPVSSSTPSWGGMPIKLPERPMQFERERLLARERAAASEQEGRASGSQ